MNWLLFAIIAIFADSLRIFIDNYSSDVYFKEKGTVSQKIILGFLYIILAIILIFISLDSIATFSTSSIILLILSGIISSVANIFYYRALELDNSTNFAIFIQLSPILYLIFGWFLYGETFSPTQLLAFCLIISAPLLVILTTRKNSRKIRIKAALMAFLFVLIAVIGNLFFVQGNSNTANFIASIAFMFIGKGLCDLLIVYSNKNLRKRFRQVFHRSKGKVTLPIFGNFLASTAKEFAYRGALIAAPTVALASAVTDSVEPILVFLMGIVLTIIWPKFGREKINRKNVIVHLIATVIIAIGITILNFSA